MYCTVVGCILTNIYNIKGDIYAIGNSVLGGVTIGSNNTFINTLSYFGSSRGC